MNKIAKIFIYIGSYGIAILIYILLFNKYAYFKNTVVNVFIISAFLISIVIILYKEFISGKLKEGKMDIQKLMEKKKVKVSRAKELFKKWYIKEYATIPYITTEDGEVLLNENTNEIFNFRNSDWHYEADGTRWLQQEVFIEDGNIGLHNFIIPLTMDEEAIEDGDFKRVSWNTEFKDVKVNNPYRRDRPFISVFGSKLQDFALKQQLTEPGLAGKEEVPLPSVREAVEESEREQQQIPQQFGKRKPYVRPTQPYTYPEHEEY